MPGGRTRTSDWIEYKQAHCKSTFSADFYLRCENEVVGLMGKKKKIPCYCKKSKTEMLSRFFKERI